MIVKYANDYKIPCAESRSVSTDKIENRVAYRAIEKISLSSEIRFFFKDLSRNVRLIVNRVRLH